jgi:TonB-linked SusC/RagA family outer membrane protein
MTIFARPRLLRLLTMLALLVPVGLRAQAAGSLTGMVTNRNLQPLGGVQVYIPGSGLGGLSNAQGRFLIPNVPAGQHVLRVEMLGYVTVSQNVAVQPGTALNLSFALEQTALAINEIVVTGVAAATPKAELPFTVERLDFSRDLAVVPSAPQNMLQGRVAGVQVISGSGQPGEDADIVLRAPTSITGGQAPLLIVDGVITSGRLSDINPQDIENIEVVKGAAAASLYGSRAQAGVINITTKRGSALEGGARFIMRTTYGKNSMQHRIPRIEHHYYKMTADGTNFADLQGRPVTLLSQRVLDDGGNGSNGFKAFAVNEFPARYPVHDPVKQFFTPGGNNEVYLAVEGRQGGLNYRISAAQGKEEGVIMFHDGTTDRSFRLNLDSQVREDLTVSLSTYFANVKQDVLSQGDGGILQSLANMDPMYDLLERDENGEIKPSVGPVGDMISNILYTMKMDEDTRNRNRYMGSLNGTYRPLSWLTIEGNASFDRSQADERHFRPKGFKRMDASGNALPDDEGRLRRSFDQIDEKNASVTASANFSLGDWTSRSRVRYLFEQREHDFWTAAGTEFAVVGVPRLGLLKGGQQLDSNFDETVAEGYFAITSVGYKSKYLVDVLGRRDGSSLFGSNERWQNYYRFSGAWRMTEEPWWPIGIINEFKPRYSVGTAGGRPRFEAQYQTYAVDRGNVSPRILGNADLKPELAKEQELGIDMVLGGRLTLNASRVMTTVEDQLLLVPLPGYYGFTAQWRNAGTLESSTWEASLQAALIERPDLIWTSFLNFNRTRQKITELGVPPYTIRHLRSTMYVVAGEPLGSFFGKKWARQCSDLPAGSNCADFDVNDEGMMVYVGSGNTAKDGRAKNLWGTTGTSGGATYSWGTPIAAAPWPEVVKMGDSEPDFGLGWGNTIQLGGLSLNTLVEGVFGPELYTTTLQWQANSANSDKAHDQADKPQENWKPLGYYFTLYDVNINNDYWVRDASFVKIREISLRYSFNRDQMARLFGNRFVPELASINLTGRNLHTWTPYDGYDPEVGRSDFLGSAVVGRIDEYSYPNYRTFGIDVELTF